MRVRHTGYAVPGWGSGDLWTSDDAVLAHEFAFLEAAPDPRAFARPADAPPLPARLERPQSVASAIPPVAPVAAPLAAPHEGAASPPTGTVPAAGSRMGHGFVPESRRPSPRAGTRAASTVAPEELVRRFSTFLAGADVDFSDVPLDLEGLTPFQTAVVGSLRTIPRGTVVSYAELAALAGYPGAQRAVGTLCARNRFAFLLPCHRVVGADGIGGYGSTGVAVKRRLLLLEGVAL